MKLTTLKSGLQKQGSRLKTISSESWRSDKTSTQRGYGYKWQQARAGYLAKHPLCCYCEREGRVTAATVVDHITPHRGDMALFWDTSNWQGLCEHHHNSDAQKKDNSLK